MRALRAILTPVLLLAGAAAAGAAPVPAAALAGAALAFAPGIAWTGWPRDRGPGELPALWFAVSLAIVALALLVALALGLSTTATLVLVAILAALGALTGNEGSGSDEARAPAFLPMTTGQTAASLAGLALFAVAASLLTDTGSIDRWWYLAYVRRDLMAGVFSTGEPFFTGAHAPARFIANPWLATMTLWAHTSGLDPLDLYEHAAPLLLVPVFASASLGLGRAVLGRHAASTLVVLAGLALWSGGLLPVLTRGPEDKFVALLALFPVASAAVLRGLGLRDDARRCCALTAAATLALALTHALVCALFLLAAAPVMLAALLAPGRLESSRRSVAALAVALAIGAAAAGATGLATRSQWIDAGAVLADPAHPVVRVHAGRERILELGEDAWMVDPALLAHPATLLALAGLLLVGGAPARGRVWILGATAIALATAFVPPLAATAGRLVLPWMVYRFLWLLPLALLLALLLEAALRRWPRRRLAVGAAALILALATFAGAVFERSRPERLALALPDDPALREVLATLRTLGPQAVVAAPPELSERLPGLAGVRVLAASDRATFVFSGDASLARRRLHARAALAAGLGCNDRELAPTHILTTPTAAQAAFCGSILVSRGDYLLCAFDGSADERRGVADAGNLSGAAPLACAAPAVVEAGSVRLPRSGPWSAAPVVLACRIAGPTPAGAVLRLQPILGRAREELLVTVDAAAWDAPLDLRVEVEGSQRLDIALPTASADGIAIQVTATYLPFLKLAAVTLLPADEARTHAAATGDTPPTEPRPPEPRS